MSFPDSGPHEEIAAALADWLTTISFDFWAALVFEPLDPAGTLTDEERQDWEESFRLTVYPTLKVPRETRDLLREALTRRSESYRYVRQARANPRGRTAQILLASDQSDLHYGNWIRQLQSRSGFQHTVEIEARMPAASHGTQPNRHRVSDNNSLRPYRRPGSSCTCN